MKTPSFALFAAGIAGLAAPAAALPLPGTGLSLNGEANLVSDYRFRGISRSGGDPALTGQLTLSHNSGFYAGARGATLDGLDRFRLRDPNFEDLGDVQLDLYAGYSRGLGLGFTLDAGLLYYTFPSGEGATNYAEPYASLSYMIGPAEATVGAKWAPSQRAIGDEDMLYLFGEVQAGIPFTPLSVVAHAGRQSWGAYGSYTNWSVGGRYVIGPAHVGLSYVDTDLPGHRGGIVAALGIRF